VVYAIGEGWTGALGSGRIDQIILGHNDEDITNTQQQSTTTGSTDSNVSSSKKSSWWSTFATKPSHSPVVLYDTSTERNNDTTTSKRLVSCAVGWGHTALIIEESITTNIKTSTATSSDNLLDAPPESVDNPVAATTSDVRVALPTQQTTFTNTQLLLTGRPHEFVSLLRLQRLPRTVRNWMTYHTYNTIRRANILERETNEHQNNTISLNPIDMIGQTLTFLTKIFGNPKKDPDWDAARDQSYLIVLTMIPLPFDSTTMVATTGSTTTADTTTLPATIDPTTPVLNDVPMDVVCTAGVTAVTTARGYVYTFGLNGIGQCGTGDPCNNVWIPSRVTGLSRQFSGAGYRATSLPQSYEIQQVCLGLQRT
jgi:Regulator of chromosome condensation (RCC1) repeat